MSSDDPGSVIATEVFTIRPFKTRAWSELERIIAGTPTLKAQLGHEVGSDLWLQSLSLADIGNELQHRAFVMFIENRTLPTAPPDELMAGWVDALDSFLGAQELEFESVTPILGLECERAPLQFDETASLIELDPASEGYYRITSAMLEVAHSQISLGVGNFTLPRHLSYAFRFTFILPKRIDTRDESKRTQIYQRLDAKRRECLRAISAATFSRALPWASYIREVGVLARQRSGVTVPYPRVVVRLDEAQARIRVTDEPLLLRAWLHVSRADFSKLNRPVRASLNRLAGLGLRAELEDQIVDAMIAAESFFGAGMKPTELAFRIAMNAAALAPSVGITEWSQSEVLHFMTKAYNLRSRIVHGDDLRTEDRRFNGEELDLNAWAFFTSEIVRRSIAWTLLRNAPGTKIAINWSDFYFSSI